MGQISKKNLSDLTLIAYGSIELSQTVWALDQSVWHTCEIVEFQLYFSALCSA